MKKISFVALLLIVLFASCKKETGVDNNYYVRFTEDGASKSFTGHVFAHRDTTSGYFSLTILGANSSTSFDNYMSLYMDNFPGHGNFNTGEYNDNSTTFTVLTTYTKNSVEHEAGQSVAQDAVSYGVTIAHHFKATITSIDNNTVRGTFSGDYYRGGDVQGANKFNITNGEFYARFQ